MVDGDPSVSSQLTQLLTAMGLNTISAPDAAQALTIATSLRPRIVLLDLWTSPGSGFQLLNALKQHPDTRAVPVIALALRDLPPEALSACARARCGRHPDETI